jgi:hypothetical protein
MRDVTLRVSLSDVCRARAVFCRATRAVVECDGTTATDDARALDGLHELTVAPSMFHKLPISPRVRVLRIQGALDAPLEVAETVTELHMPRLYDARLLRVPCGLAILSLPAAQNVHDHSIFRSLHTLDVSYARPFPTLELAALRHLVARGTFMRRGSLRFLESLATLDARDAKRLDLCTAAALRGLEVDARGAALPWEERESLTNATARFSLEGAFWHVGPLVYYALDTGGVTRSGYSR